VTEVEDVGRAGGVGVGVGLTKAVEHAVHFGGDVRRWRKPPNCLRNDYNLGFEFYVLGSRF
jgi:hypothetical protein